MTVDCNCNLVVAEVLREVDRRPTLARVVAANRQLDEIANSDGSPFRQMNLLVVRNFTFEPVEPYLRLAAFRDGVRLDVRWSGYDPTPEEVTDLLVTKADATALFLRIEELAPALAEGFSGLDTQAASTMADEALGRVLALARAALRAGAPVLVHNFILPAWPAGGLCDSQRPLGQLNLTRRMNLDLAAAVPELEGAYIVDVDHVLAGLGGQGCYDARSSRMSGAPFSAEALKRIAAALVRHIRALRGPKVKCLVVDCDNTLWGGVLGEVGLAGIVLGDTGSGRVHRDLHQKLLDLKRRGVLLALASRNEESEVLAVLREHPECLLREDDFAAIRVNWEDKAANVRSIAAELNLGLDQLAFLDDDEFECGNVSAQLPEVAVLRWPVDVDGPQWLDSTELFDSLMVTEEDSVRTDLYRAEAARRRVEAEATSSESYLHSLGLRATVEPAAPAQLGRLAQLTQRTNQFNLTTRRYGLADMERIASRDQTVALGLQLEDRFGSYGLVGCAILVVEGAEALIDTFLLSCRVLGRRAEGVLLNRLARWARRLGASVLIGDYLPTPRNQQVAELYAKAGFDGPEAIEGGGTRWRWPLCRGDPPAPGWVEVVDQDRSANALTLQ